MRGKEHPHLWHSHWHFIPAYRQSDRLRVSLKWARYLPDGRRRHGQVKHLRDLLRRALKQEERQRLLALSALR